MGDYKEAKEPVLGYMEEGVVKGGREEQQAWLERKEMGPSAVRSRRTLISSGTWLSSRLCFKDTSSIHHYHRCLLEIPNTLVFLSDSMLHHGATWFHVQDHSTNQPFSPLVIGLRVICGHSILQPRQCPSSPEIGP